ncbi:hypothetical protein THRCLA_01883, partial [Thraustotheca clavata]
MSSGNNTTKSLKSLKREIDILQMCRSPYIIRLLAVSNANTPKLALVIEYMNAGNLDFGAARNIDVGMTANVGTVGYIAPEVLNGNNYEEPCGIYSFGVIMTDGVSCGELKPSLSNTCEDLYRDIALQCLEFNPKECPTAHVIVGLLYSATTSEYF